MSGMIARARRAGQHDAGSQGQFPTQKPYEGWQDGVPVYGERLGIPLAPEETGFLAIHIQRVMQ